MDPHLFFKGSIGREIVSSAFLATVLEQYSDERSVFFDLISENADEQQEALDLIAALKALPRLNVEVERDQVDVFLSDSEEKPSYIILIENKLLSGSLQTGQLLRYYAQQRRKHPEARIAAIFLAPGGAGQAEVDLVRKESLLSGDVAIHVSWEDLKEALLKVSQSESIKKGLECIAQVIERGRQEVYPLDGDRLAIHQIVSDVREQLVKNSPIRLSTPWPASNMFTLATYGTNLTAWFRFIFEVRPETDQPLNLCEGEKMRLTFQSMLKISAAGSRSLELKSQWKMLEKEGVLDVQGAGVHKLQGRWLTFECHCIASPSELVEQFASLSGAALRLVENWGQAEGKPSLAKGVGEA